MSERLEAAWSALWRRVGRKEDGEATHRDLVRRHSEPHRAYHTLAHIEHCLDEFETVRAAARDPDAVELALWFHDAVYRPRAGDNEARSADLVRPISARAAELVLATRHAAPPEDPDAELVVDVDLAILGQPADRFDRYEVEIRKEFAWVPGFLFRRKRAAVLRSFLDRPSIYRTPWFRGRYETAARLNLERSLAKLND
jgi:predicted metal-dependent HD superfamily phosphohydrolase